MSAEETKAALVRPPFDLGSNEFGVLKFTAGTTHGANLIPLAWHGKWVKITVVGGVLHYGFSNSSSAEIDSSVSATAAGASAKVGGYLADGGSVHVRIPGTSERLYFCREASASCDVYMELASD